MAKSKKKSPEQELRENDPELFKYIIAALDRQERKEKADRERRTIRIEIIRR